MLNPEVFECRNNRATSKVTSLIHRTLTEQPEPMGRIDIYTENTHGYRNLYAAKSSVTAETPSGPSDKCSYK